VWETERVKNGTTRTPDPVCHPTNWHTVSPLAPKTCYNKDMNETNLPSEAILKILATALAERLNGVIVEECADLIMETTSDVIGDELGDGFDREVAALIAMELSGRIAFVAV